MPNQSLIVPRYIVPVRPRACVLENHALFVEDSRIVSILPAQEARAKYGGADVVALDDRVVLPGLINMHTHSPMSLLRGIADDLDMQTWLREHIWPIESRCVSPEFVADGTRLAMAEMIRAGTTCFNDIYFFPGEMAKVALEVGMRAIIGLPLLDQPTCWARDFDEYLRKGLEVRDRFGDAPLVRFTLAPHAPYSVCDENLEQVGAISRDEGLKVHLHCLETPYDIDHSLAHHGVRPLDRLEDKGLLTDQLIAVHMTQLEDREIERVAQSETHVVHCPQSNMKLASGVCPVAALLDAGVNVSVGTDGAASNNNLDLLEEVRFAALLAKGFRADANVVDAVTAVDMMTINGATALGLESEIGTLEVGKKADLCAMDLSSPQTQPVHDLFSLITYAASSAQFTDVWVGGRRLMRESRLVTLEEQAIRGCAEDWRARLHGRENSREVAI